MPSDRDADGPSESDDRELYEHAPCAYLSTQIDGTIVRGNATFFEWIGTPANAIVRKRRFQSLLTIGAGTSSFNKFPVNHVLAWTSRLIPMMTRQPR